MSSCIQMSIIDDFTSLHKIEDEWDGLLNELSEGMVFQTYLWNHQVGKSFSRENEIQVFCFRKDGLLVGILPLRKVSRNLKIYKYEIINFFTHNKADCQDMIGEEDISECLSIFTEYLTTNKFSWDVIYLRNIPKKSHTVVELVKQLNRRNFITNTSEGNVCPTILINESYDQYQSKLRRKMLSDLRRRERRLREQGELTMTRYSGETDLESLARGFIDLHIERWGETNTQSKFLKQEQRDYYLSLFAKLYDHDILDLYYMKCNGRFIAFQFCTKYSNNILFHATCHDPDFRRFSPAKILLFHIINKCFENNVSSFNFLAGAEDYKSDWTNKQNHTINLCAFRNRISKLIYDLFYNSNTYLMFSKFKRSL